MADVTSRASSASSSRTTLPDVPQACKVMSAARKRPVRALDNWHEAADPWDVCVDVIGLHGAEGIALKDLFTKLTPGALYLPYAKTVKEVTPTLRVAIWNKLKQLCPHTLTVSPDVETVAEALDEDAVLFPSRELSLLSYGMHDKADLHDDVVEKMFEIVEAVARVGGPRGLKLYDLCDLLQRPVVPMRHAITSATRPGVISDNFHTCGNFLTLQRFPEAWNPLSFDSRASLLRLTKHLLMKAKALEDPSSTVAGRSSNTTIVWGLSAPSVIRSTWGRDVQCAEDAALFRRMNRSYRTLVVRAYDEAMRDADVATLRIVKDKTKAVYYIYDGVQRRARTIARGKSGQTVVEQLPNGDGLPWPVCNFSIHRQIMYVLNQAGHDGIEKALFARLLRTQFRKNSCARLMSGSVIKRKFAHEAKVSLLGSSREEQSTAYHYVSNEHNKEEQFNLRLESQDAEVKNGGDSVSPEVVNVVPATDDLQKNICWKCCLVERAKNLHLRLYSSLESGALKVHPGDSSFSLKDLVGCFSLLDFNRIFVFMQNVQITMQYSETMAIAPLGYPVSMLSEDELGSLLSPYSVLSEARARPIFKTMKRWATPADGRVHLHPGVEGAFDMLVRSNIIEPVAGVSPYPKYKVVPSNLVPSLTRLESNARRVSSKTDDGLEPTFQIVSYWNSLAGMPLSDKRSDDLFPRYDLNGDEEGHPTSNLSKTQARLSLQETKKLKKKMEAEKKMLIKAEQAKKKKTLETESKSKKRVIAQERGASSSKEVEHQGNRSIAPKKRLRRDEYIGEYAKNFGCQETKALEVENLCAGFAFDNLETRIVSFETKPSMWRSDLNKSNSEQRGVKPVQVRGAQDPARVVKLILMEYPNSSAAFLKHVLSSNRMNKYAVELVEECLVSMCASGEVEEIEIGQKKVYALTRPRKKVVDGSADGEKSSFGFRSGGSGIMMTSSEEESNDEEQEFDTHRSGGGDTQHV
jgi:hypothetical protein